MDMRHLINLVESQVGHNNPPEDEISLVPNGKMGSEKFYIIKLNGKKIGTAFAKYKAPKPGHAGGTTFTAVMKGDHHLHGGSKTNLLKAIKNYIDENL